MHNSGSPERGYAKYMLRRVHACHQFHSTLTWLDDFFSKYSSFSTSITKLTYLLSRISSVWEEKQWDLNLIKGFPSFLDDLLHQHWLSANYIRLWCYSLVSYTDYIYLFLGQPSWEVPQLKVFSYWTAWKGDLVVQIMSLNMDVSTIHSNQLNCVYFAGIWGAFVVSRICLAFSCLSPMWSSCGMVGITCSVQRNMVIMLADI